MLIKFNEDDFKKLKIISTLQNSVKIENNFKTFNTEETISIYSRFNLNDDIEINILYLDRFIKLLEYYNNSFEYDKENNCLNFNNSVSKSKLNLCEDEFVVIDMDKVEKEKLQQKIICSFELKKEELQEIRKLEKMMGLNQTYFKIDNGKIHIGSNGSENITKDFTSLELNHKIEDNKINDIYYLNEFVNIPTDDYSINICEMMVSEEDSIKTFEIISKNIVMKYKIAVNMVDND